MIYLRRLTAARSYAKAAGQMGTTMDVAPFAMAAERKKSLFVFVTMVLTKFKTCVMIAL